MVRLQLDDRQWARIEAVIAAERRAGRPPKDNRNFVEAVLWWRRTGVPWRDLPGDFGPWKPQLESRLDVPVPVPVPVPDLVSGPLRARGAEQVGDALAEGGPDRAGLGGLFGLELLSLGAARARRPLDAFQLVGGDRTSVV